MNTTARQANSHSSASARVLSDQAASFVRACKELEGVKPHPWYWGDDWDRHIVRYVLNNTEPGGVRIVTVADHLAKGFAKGKKHRSEVWLYVEARIRALIKLTVLVRTRDRRCKIGPLFAVPRKVEPMDLPQPNL